MRAVGVGDAAGVTWDSAGRASATAAAPVIEEFRNSRRVVFIPPRPVRRGGQSTAPQLRPLAIVLYRLHERAVNACYARPANSRVSVWTLTFSPSLMNNGTRISSPVWSVASFVTLPLAVSPRTPGGVDVTVSSTGGGNCTQIGEP